MTLNFDQSVNTGLENDFGEGESDPAERDMLEVSVTITYDDGYRETYVTQIQAPEDDAR